MTHVVTFAHAGRITFVWPLRNLPLVDVHVLAQDVARRCRWTYSIEVRP